MLVVVVRQAPVGVGVPVATALATVCAKVCEVVGVVVTTIVVPCIPVEGATALRLGPTVASERVLAAALMSAYVSDPVASASTLSWTKPNVVVVVLMATGVHDVSCQPLATAACAALPFRPSIASDTAHDLDLRQDRCPKSQGTDCHGDTDDKRIWIHHK